MSNWAAAVTAIATAVIAWATTKTWFVYSRMYGQVEQQTKLTHDMFLESHKPMLSASIKKCEYSESEGLFTGYIQIKNYGSVVANQIDLTFAFGGTNFIKKVSQIAIRPKDKIRYPLSLKMTAHQYSAGCTEGNRIDALIYGSYKGIADQTYSYNERQHFYPELKRFVPVIAW
jgi:hypothetical protein